MKNIHHNSFPYLGKLSPVCLPSSFHSFVYDPANHKFSKKFTNNGATLWLEKLHNKNGYYFELPIPHGPRTKIFIPSEDKKQGFGSLFTLLSQTI